ncbi:MAG: CotH kinase family protein [Oscillospiraceae bacterium]|nr:CotH kinase family protein [Oscillospiraceae bacterium]
MKRLLPLCLALLLLLTGCAQGTNPPTGAPEASTAGLSETPAAVDGTSSAKARSEQGEAASSEPSSAAAESPYGRLPAVWLTTDSGRPVTSKTELVNGTFALKIGEKTLYSPSLSLPAQPMRIRGRGSSSWEWPKTPYLVKLDKSTSLFGLPKAHDWILRPSYSDKSLIRDHLAFVMGHALGNLGFVPHSVLVDVYFNNTYQGVYILCEQVEAAPGRVELDVSAANDTGFLLEIGGNDEGDLPGRDYFSVSSFVGAAYVKNPKAGVRTAAQMRFITQYVQQADAAVVSLSNYEDYIDIPSLIDWFILHELTYNLDSSFRRSCFFTKDAGGKLKMGPPWDFDLAFGNHFRYVNYPNVWASVSREDGYVGVTWMDHLLKDPRFTARLKARWNEVGGALLRTALREIDLCESVIDLSQKENYKVWDTMGKKAGFEPAGIARLNTYAAHLQHIRNFLTTRKAWMDKAIGAM